MQPSNAAPSVTSSPQPTNHPTLSNSLEPTVAQLQKELQQHQQSHAAMSQIIWNLVQRCQTDDEAENGLMVSSLASDPLWHLVFLQADKENSDGTLVRILAGTMPPITEGEKKRVVRLLRGTEMSMLDALNSLEMQYPPSYVEMQIKAHLAWKAPTLASEGVAATNGRWESVVPPGLAERAKNLLRVAKK